MRFFQFKFKQKKEGFMSQNMIQANKPYNCIYRFCDKSFFVILQTMLTVCAASYNRCA